MKITLLTKLSIEECIQRIEKDAIEDGTLSQLKAFFYYYYPKEIIFYEFKSHSVRLQNFRYSRNAFTSYFYGKFIEESNGTKIEGQFHVHLFIKLFMTIWFAIAIVFGSAVFLVSLMRFIAPNKITNVSYSGNPIIGIIFPIGFIAFGVGIIKYGQYLGKKDEKAIISFLEKTCEAKNETRIL